MTASTVLPAAALKIIRDASGAKQIPQPTLHFAEAIWRIYSPWWEYTVESAASRIPADAASVLVRKLRATARSLPADAYEARWRLIDLESFVFAHEKRSQPTDAEWGDFKAAVTRLQSEGVVAKVAEHGARSAKAANPRTKLGAQQAYAFINAKDGGVPWPPMRPIVPVHKGRGDPRDEQIKQDSLVIMRAAMNKTRARPSFKRKTACKLARCCALASGDKDAPTVNAIELELRALARDMQRTLSD